MKRSIGLILVLMVTLAFLATCYFWDHRRHWLAALAYALLICLAFDRKRQRERWANLALILSGLLGVGHAGMSYYAEVGVLEMSGNLGVVMATLRGMILGAISTVGISGQLVGRERSRIAERE